MTNQVVTISQPLAPGDSLTITVAPVVTPPIANLQAALNATPAGGTLDAGGVLYKLGQVLTIPAGVTLANALLTYTGPATATQTGFIDLSASSVLKASTVNGAGLAYATVRAWVGATKAQIIGCNISGGRYLGVIGYQCNGLLIRSTRIHTNNVAGGQEGYEAGGIKLGNTSGYVISGVEVDHNGGPGVWEDVSCSGGSITACKVHDNTYAGIMSEISTVGADIVGNSVWECGWGDSRITSTALWGAAILLSSTTGAKATGNTAAWCPCGIGAISQAGRTSSVKGTTATGNAIAQSKGAPVITYNESGAPSDWGPWTPNSTATAAQLAAAGVPPAPQPGH